MNPVRVMGHVAPALASRRCDRLMWITPERVFYQGLLGAPAPRTMGSLMLYAAVEGRLRWRRPGGDWQACTLAVVPPWVPHQVHADARLIDVLKFESETVEPAALPAPLRGCGPLEAPDLLARIRAVASRLAERAGAPEPGMNFDEVFLAERLPRRRLDPRIDQVAEHLRRLPASPLGAQQHAHSVNLSFSRFLHLFKGEIGVPFRVFRAWKRARDLLHYVNGDASLAQVALEAGYPDSTHFSHSIRQVYGLKPRDIFAGSRRLAIYAQPAGHAAG